MSETFRDVEGVSILRTEFESLPLSVRRRIFPHVNDDIKEYVLQGYSAMELKREAVKLGMQTLRQSAINKLMSGMITVDEVLRITRADS